LTAPDVPVAGMADPFQLFEQADAGRQESLRVIWPELHAMLAREDEPASERTTRCAVYATHEIGTHAVAVGRLVADGPPACAECVAKAATREGGYPLTREARR